ncbi:ribbon-helix-helix domain-containing protein [Endozoicomonas sp.]|uniref:ribbon-helix-helix domain-containing protein n=1 Tax=Endozoicomonas sp. TaxID=1892382 RepID=UPI003AF5775C
MKKSQSTSDVLGFRVSSDLIKRLDSLAKQDHRTRSQMARLLIEKALRDQEKVRRGKRFSTTTE